MTGEGFFLARLFVYPSHWKRINFENIDPVVGPRAVNKSNEDRRFSRAKLLPNLDCGAMLVSDIFNESEHVRAEFNRHCKLSSTKTFLAKAECYTN